MEAGDYEAAVGMMQSAAQAKGWRCVEECIAHQHGTKVMATVEARVANDDAPEAVGAAAALAVMVHGWLQAYVHETHTTIVVHVSRPATEEEIARHQRKAPQQTEAA